MLSSELEIAAGTPLGGNGGRIGRDRVPVAGPSPLEALEHAVRPALESGSCLVSFSGGRDSSCVLAAAVRAARCWGLNPPIPVSLRYPDAPLADESDWQEIVIRSLQLDDWHRVEVPDADLIGPLAEPALRRHGLLYPPNVHLQRPVFAIAGGGTVLTGLGGDQLLGRWRRRLAADVIARRRPLRAVDGIRLAYVGAPKAVRLPRELRRELADAPAWIRSGARRKVAWRIARGSVREPLWWSERIRWRAGRPDLLITQASLNLLAEEQGVAVHSPLLDPGFVDAMARVGGRLGFADRTATMLAVFDGLLPEALLRRGSKAIFDEVLWGHRSREFAQHWDGRGVDPEIVDSEALRREWLSPSPHARTALLLQAAWLRGDGARPPG